MKWSWVWESTALLPQLLVHSVLFPGPKLRPAEHIAWGITYLPSCFLWLNLPIAVQAISDLKGLKLSRAHVTHCLPQGSAKDGPRAKSSPLPAFINGVLLACSQGHSLYIVSDCFCAKIAELSTVGPSYLRVLHAWSQPIWSENIQKKMTSVLTMYRLFLFMSLFSKLYSRTTIYLTRMLQ